MSTLVGLRTRAATAGDVAAIVAIYNGGIADRIATFETEPRSPAQIAEWFDRRHPILVAETEETGPMAFAAAFPCSDRCCYAGIAEFSVYVARACRGRGAGKAVLAAFIEACAAAGFYKLVSRVFVENGANRALLRRLGFAEIGVHRRHGTRRWRLARLCDCRAPSRPRRLAHPDWCRSKHQSECVLLKLEG